MDLDFSGASTLTKILIHSKKYNLKTLAVNYNTSNSLQYFFYVDTWLQPNLNQLAPDWLFHALMSQT